MPVPLPRGLFTKKSAVINRRGSRGSRGGKQRVKRKRRHFHTNDLGLLYTESFTLDILVQSQENLRLVFNTGKWYVERSPHPLNCNASVILLRLTLVLLHLLRLHLSCSQSSQKQQPPSLVFHALAA